MTNSEKRETMVKAATGYFKEGLNCSECVFKGYLDMGDSGFPDEVIAFASPFGGGIGHTKNTCGALIGACLAVGAIKGRKDPMSAETNEERREQLQGEGGIYPLFGGIVNEFVEVVGSAKCSEICEPFGDFDSIERKRNCKNVIKQAAIIASNHIYKD